MRTLVLALLVTVLAACATPRVIRSDVTSYENWSVTATGPKTFRFERTPEQADSLEHKVYEDLVREQMLGLGFTESEPGRYTVTLGYSITGREVTVRETDWIDEPRMPWYGPIARTPSGRIIYGWGYDPLWPWASRPITRETTRQVWRRELHVDIREPAAGLKVYEGKVVSEGSTDQLNPVMPYLVRALFSQFPGGNGQTRRVDLPIENKP